MGQNVGWVRKGGNQRESYRGWKVEERWETCRGNKDEGQLKESRERRSCLVGQGWHLVGWRRSVRKVGMEKIATTLQDGRKNGKEVEFLKKYGRGIINANKKMYQEYGRSQRARGEKSVTEKTCRGNWFSGKDKMTQRIEKQIE